MAILFYCILLSSILTGTHGAKEFRVGGTDGWAVPNNTNTECYNNWAGQTRFQVGDSLVFVYKCGEDSVLRVSQTDYINCRTSQPIASFDDGNTVFALQQPGPFFFISGASGHCQKSQKLHVIVLGIRGQSSSSLPSPSPHAVAPLVPAPAPLIRTTPSPSPSPSPSLSPSPSPSPSPSLSPSPSPSPSPIQAAAAAPSLQSAGFMGALLISICVFIL